MSVKNAPLKVELKEESGAAVTKQETFEEIVKRSTAKYHQWFKLAEPEIITNEATGQKFIKLETLDRLGFIKGYISRESIVEKTPSENDAVAVVKCRILWKDGCTTEAIGDATPANCDEGFDKYLIAIAESRAYARALRKGLHINVCSREEVAETVNAKPKSDGFIPATATQLKAINNLMEKKGIKWADTPYNEKALENLSKDEASKMMGWLQSNKKG